MLYEFKSQTSNQIKYNLTMVNSTSYKINGINRTGKYAENERINLMKSNMEDMLLLVEIINNIRTSEAIDTYKKTVIVSIYTNKSQLHKFYV